MKCAEEEHSCGQVRRAGCCLMTLKLGALVEQSRLPNGPIQWPYGSLGGGGGWHHWKMKTYTCARRCRHEAAYATTTEGASSLQGWKEEGGPRWEEETGWKQEERSASSSGGAPRGDSTTDYFWTERAANSRELLTDGLDICSSHGWVLDAVQTRAIKCVISQSVRTHKHKDQI